MAEMIRRCPDVRPDGVPHQCIRILLEIGLHQRFDGRADAVDDRSKIGRPAFRRTLELFQCGFNGAAHRVTQDHDKPRAESFGRKLDTADVRWGDDVAGHTDDEQVAQALMENDFRRHPRVGAAENDGERLLTRYQFSATFLTGGLAVSANVRQEMTIPFSEALECFTR